VNAAVFKTDYEGIQLNFQQGVSPTIQNAGDAEIKGAELEVLAALTEGFTLSASAGYTDSEYTKVLPEAVVAPNPFQAGVNVGDELPKTPEFKFNLSPRYEFSVGEGSIVLLADYTWTDEMRNDTEGTFLIARDSTEMLNASVTYRSASRKWEVTLGGTNLTDERFLVTGQAQIAGGQIYGTWNRPREWYLTLHARQ
jgi:iron complex outermembrane receptor protein